MQRVKQPELFFLLYCFISLFVHKFHFIFRPNNPKEVWISQLSQIHMVSSTIARKIAEKYPSFSKNKLLSPFFFYWKNIELICFSFWTESLMDVYCSPSFTEEQKKNVLASIEVSEKKIGSAISKRIYKIFTTKNANELVIWFCQIKEYLNLFLWKFFLFGFWTNLNKSKECRKERFFFFFCEQSFVSCDFDVEGFGNLFDFEYESCFCSAPSQRILPTSTRFEERLNGDLDETFTFVVFNLVCSYQKLICPNRRFGCVFCETRHKLGHLVRSCFRRHSKLEKYAQSLSQIKVLQLWL